MDEEIPTDDVVSLQGRRDQTLFETQTLERDLTSIREQLDEAAFSDDPERQEGSEWWRRARDAQRHKEREHRIAVARFNRLVRRLARVKPDVKKAQAKQALREVLKTLFIVARASLAFYEDGTDEAEDALAQALDRLDQVVPGWEGPQERTTFRKMDIE